MKFSTNDNLKTADGDPIYDAFDIHAGLTDYDRAATCWFRINGSPSSSAKKITGRIMFPERAESEFDGSLAEFKRVLREAPSWYAVAQHEKFTGYRD